MEKKSIIKIGFLAVVALGLVGWGLSFLKGEKLFKPENQYVALYDKLDGLAESNPVMLSGYKIGTVKSIEFKEINGELKIVVLFSVNNDFNLPLGTVLKIVSVDIMGTKGVEVVRPKIADGYYKNGDTLKGVTDGGILDQLLGLVMPMKDDLTNLMLTTDSVMCSLNKLLNEKNIKNIASGLENLELISRHLGGKIGTVDSMIDDFNKLSKTVAKNSGNIDRAMKNFTDLSDTLNSLELNKLLYDARKALDEVNSFLTTVNSKDGTVQNFLNSDSVYNNIETLSAKLNTLIDDFSAHPKKYINLTVFGGKENKKSRESANGTPAKN